MNDALNNNASEELFILIVEDDKGLCKLIEKRLSRQDYNVVSVNKGADAIDYVKKHDNLLLILDYHLPDIEGKEFIDKMKEINDSIPFIVMTGYGDINNAVEMMKMGALDYLVKDSSFIDIMPTIIEKAVTDIKTKIKLLETQKALLHTEEQIKIFQSFANTSGQGFAMANFDGKLIYVNPALSNLLGYENEKEILNKELLSFFPSNSKERLTKELFPRVKSKGKWVGELSLLQKKGPEIPCLINMFLVRNNDNKPMYIAGLITDMTEKKQAEEFLHLQISALDAAANAIVITNLKGDIVWCNNAFEDLTGYEKEEVIYKNLSILHSGKQSKEFYENMWKSILEGNKWHGEIINQRKNGVVYIEEQTITPVFNKDGNLTYFVAVKQDITERKRAEKEIKELNEYLEKRVKNRTKELQEMNEALHESEEKYRTLFESNSDAVMLIDNLRIVDCNPAALEVFGCENKEGFIGKTILDFSPEEQPTGTNSEEEIIKHLDFTYLNNNDKYEWLHLHKNGTPFNAEVWLTQMDLAGENFIQAVVRDITEKKRAEKELKLAQAKLVQAEKMAALGELVAGVAHEINTPIGIGVTAASYLNDKTKGLLNSYDNDLLKKSELEKYFDVASSATNTILNNLEKAADLVRSFKQVAVDQSSDELRTFKVCEYLDEILLSLKPKLKKTKHEIFTSCDENISIKSYPGAIYQIITNLVINSLIHGFEEKESGKIVIDIKLKENYLKLNYSDDGKGIRKENIKKIFDPFYTTKRGMGGSGLGLHIVYNLVLQKLKGTIDVESDTEKGVNFLIVFPVTKE